MYSFFQEQLFEFHFPISLQLMGWDYEVDNQASRDEENRPYIFCFLLKFWFFCPYALVNREVRNIHTHQHTPPKQQKHTFFLQLQRKINSIVTWELPLYTSVLFRVLTRTHTSLKHLLNSSVLCPAVDHNSSKHWHFIIWHGPIYNCILCPQIWQL